MIEWIKQNYIPIIMIVVIFMVISLYVLTANNRYDGNYNSIKNQQWHKISPEFGSVISNSNSMFNKRYGLKDYYILASYNSCIGGYLKNDFVDKRPLTEVIKKGARFLDFEIWNVDNEAVVAAGIENSETTFKGTFNHLPFNDVMSHVNRLAFNGSMSPNSEDPLFLLFRMKTKNTNIYNSMTKTIKTLAKDMPGEEASKAPPASWPLSQWPARGPASRPLGQPSQPGIADEFTKKPPNMTQGMVRAELAELAEIMSL